jgi:hypothetical protein
MAPPAKKHFTIVKPCPIIIDEDKFRFARFILLKSACGTSFTHACKRCM